MQGSAARWVSARQSRCAACAKASAQSADAQELHRAVASRTGSLVETVLTTSSGSPLFCLAYVMPLHCNGARHGTTAVAFLDVHHSLPYMQKQMESRELVGCDLYTFLKFSLLNCLVTDPSGADPAPAKRNPIIFASAGFSSMCGAAPESVGTTLGSTTVMDAASYTSQVLDRKSVV